MSLLKQTWVKVILAAMGSGVLLVFLMIGGCWSLFSWSNRQALAEWNTKMRLPFDQKVWLAEAESKSQDPPRLRMVDDLLATHDFKGRSREEVEALLGPGTKIALFRNYGLIYWLGPERGSLRIDSEWLGFRFGNDGRVSQCVLLRD